jgi:hypothetical protein
MWRGHLLASEPAWVPVIPKFANERAARSCELRNRTLGAIPSPLDGEGAADVRACIDLAITLE